MIGALSSQSHKLEKFISICGAKAKAYQDRSHDKALYHGYSKSQKLEAWTALKDYLVAKLKNEKEKNLN